MEKQEIKLIKKVMKYAVINTSSNQINYQGQMDYTKDIQDLWELEQVCIDKCKEEYSTDIPKLDHLQVVLLTQNNALKTALDIKHMIDNFGVLNNVKNGELSNNITIDIGFDNIEVYGEWIYEYHERMGKEDIYGSNVLLRQHNQQDIFNLVASKLAQFTIEYAEELEAKISKIKGALNDE